MDKYDVNAYTDPELHEIVGYDPLATPPENLEEILIDKLRTYMYSRVPAEIQMFNFIKNIYIRFFDDFEETPIKTDDFQYTLSELEKADFAKKDATNAESLTDTTDKYNVAKYNTKEKLYPVLDLSPGASDGEIEAKIIQRLQEYKTATTPQGIQIFTFYSEIYSHFFHPNPDLTQEEERKVLTTDPAPTETPEIVVGKDNPTNMTYTKTLDYSKGKINPILKETYRRIISIDSQYRDEEYLSATDFTLNITETLKDVVSLKLYAVQIPVTWYTISNNYGSNYFMVKPIISDGTLAISSNAAHEYKVEIQPGNYTQKTLSAQITKKMESLSDTYPDVSFGQTTFSYGDSNGKSIITIDIQKVYNESYYDMIIKGGNTKLLLNMQDLSINSFYSSKLPTLPDRYYIVDPQNNKMMIEQYLPTSPTTVLKTVTIELTPGTDLSMASIAQDLNTKLASHPDLYNSTLVRINDGTISRYKCSIYLNRYKSQNIVNAKLRVSFPDTTLDANNQATDGTARILWQSGFNFPPSSLAPIVITNIITDLSDQTLRVENEQIIFRPKYDVSGGVYISPTANTNDIILNITNNTYTVNQLIDHLNGLISQYPILSGTVFSTTQTKVLLSININKVYTSADYRIVFYDIYSFTKCTKASNSYRNATADTTLGYILGYKELAEYNLTSTNLSVSTGKFITPDYLMTSNNYTFVDTITRTLITLEGDSVLSIYLYNYFMIILDDFNQNHLNDGLVTVSKRDTSVTLPGYANRRKLKACDAITGKAIGDSSSASSFSTQGLTEKQVYSVEQILATQNRTKDVMNAGPFIKDMFALLPIKASGVDTGSIYVEFGGTLQQQERVYFGPVNVNRLSVKLINDKGDVVDLNGANWSFQLVCEQLYQKGVEI